MHELAFDDERFTLGDEVDKENLTANLESGVPLVTALRLKEVGSITRKRKMIHSYVASHGDPNLHMHMCE